MACAFPGRTAPVLPSLPSGELAVAERIYHTCRSVDLEFDDCLVPARRRLFVVAVVVEIVG